MKKFDSIFFALIVFAIAPNARPIFKYLTAFQPLALLTYAVAVIALIYFLAQKNTTAHFKKWIGSYGYILFVLLAVSVVIWFLYPIADGLKLQMRGSDQDDCVIIGSTKLLNLSHPYTQRTYFGSPCSPGLGMLLLYLPFVLLKIYPLGAIFFAVLAIFTIQRYTSDTYEAAVFTTLLFTSIFTMEMLVVGSDLFLLGCGLIVLSFNVVHAIKKKTLSKVLWLAVLAGLLASTRVNFLVIVPIISVFIYMHWRKGGLVFAALSFCVAVLPSVYVYFLSPLQFTPLHLLGKSDYLLQGGLKEIASVISVLAFLIGSYFVKKSINHIPAALFLSLAPSLIALAIGDLLLRGGDFAQWEGANYLLPILPLSLAILTNRIIQYDEVVQ